jgi:hypothetical protein
MDVQVTQYLDRTMTVDDDTGRFCQSKVVKVLLMK